MRNTLLYILIFLIGTSALGQNKKEGSITYITSQHIYVKFNSMDGIKAGDTLFIRQGDRELAVLHVMNLSSTSCVCDPLVSRNFKVSELVYANIPAETLPVVIQAPLKIDSSQLTQEPVPESPPEDSTQKGQFKQLISGRLSASAYSNFANSQSPGNQRMRYTFSLRANHLGNTGLSLESYVSFAHNLDQWAEVKENIFNGLKIYNLSVKYDIGESMYILLGRKINPRLSSVGAIDGLQVEKRFGSITVGAFGGSRPDYADYSFNFNLLQYGGFLGHDLSTRNGSMQSSAAFIEQTNHSMTDRRFAYFQHSNSIIKNLFFFGSAEIDLYKKVNETAESTFDLSNIYLSLRYRIIKPLSLGISYSARNNIIYYETYKDFLERLLDNEKLQGWRLRLNYRPAQYLYIGVNAGYRFRKEDPQPTRNVHGYLTYSRIPGIGGSVTGTAAWLETSYLKGMIYGLGYSRDFVNGKLNSGIKYKYVDYFYRNSEMDLIQHVAEANLSWSVYRKLLLSIYYEGTFEKDIPYHRLYLNITQRF